jgi:hypothetical protein
MLPDTISIYAFHPEDRLQERNINEKENYKKQPVT